MNSTPFLRISAIALTLGVATANLGGCAMASAPVENETMEALATRLVKGQTTKEQVRANYGEPSASGIKNGLDYWQYHNVKTNFISSKSTYLTIYFERGGVVYSYDLEKF